MSNNYEIVLLGNCKNCKKSNIIVEDDILFCINCDEQIYSIEEPTSESLDDIAELMSNISVGQDMTVYNEMMKEIEKEEEEKSIEDLFKKMSVKKLKRPIRRDSPKKNIIKPKRK